MPVTQRKSFRPASHSQYPSIHCAFSFGASTAGRSTTGGGGALAMCCGSRSFAFERNASWSGPWVSGVTRGSACGTALKDRRGIEADGGSRARIGGELLPRAGAAGQASESDGRRDRTDPDPSDA